MEPLENQPAEAHYQDSVSINFARIEVPPQSRPSPNGSNPLVINRGDGCEFHEGEADWTQSRSGGPGEQGFLTQSGLGSDAWIILAPGPGSRHRIEAAAH